jgi:PPK2 family polyphosphate:nucleotide phosphotransferase
MKLSKQLHVKPGAKIRLSDIDPRDTLGYKDKDSIAKAFEKSKARLYDLHYRLYAEHQRALLIANVNPQSCRVTSFKVPTAEELDHDFLWRIHKATPRRGEIGIFNRSHYEDVLVARVHSLVPREVWEARYEQINAFEKTLVENGTRIVKFFLHIGKAEQKARFQERLDDPAKHWKLSPADFEERQRWPDYMKAYEEVFHRCSTPWAPWYIIPSDRKWFRNFAVSNVIVETLRDMDPRFPPPTLDVSKIVLK